MDCITGSTIGRILISDNLFVTNSVIDPSNNIPVFTASILKSSNTESICDSITDNDLDDDGVTNDKDAFPNDPNEWKDTDNDGTGDNADKDIDGDGVANGEDLNPLDPKVTVDNNSAFLGLIVVLIIVILLVLVMWMKAKKSGPGELDEIEISGEEQWTDQEF